MLEAKVAAAKLPMLMLNAGVQLGIDVKFLLALVLTPRAGVDGFCIVQV